MRFKRECKKIFSFIGAKLTSLPTQGESIVFVKAHPLVASGVGTLIVLIVWMTASQGADQTRMIFKREGMPDFKNASILGNPGQAVLNGEEKLFSKQQKLLTDSQTQIKTELEQLRVAVQGLSNKAPGIDVMGPQPSASPSLITPSITPGQSQAEIQIQPQVGPPPEEYSATRYTDRIIQTRSAPARFSFAGKPGHSMIAFPVKTTGAVYLKKPSVILPTGSYVKAKLLTGIEAPEGKTYPALLQLDFAFIIPNQKRLDLAGCFMIAKAQGDLSTERVQMQATKLSCVSKHGGMFEREINGFVADDADNSFAVMGSVNSKQDRVASMAFLSSIVSGIGKAIQQAQTTQQTTPLGGSQSVITGDQAKYIGAGGASEAATMVTQWYLKQAQNLLPTINVGSGQDIWVILQDQVELPKDYFAQNSSTAGGANDVSIYSHFTRLVD